MYFSLLTILLACSTHAIQIKPSYGPPTSQRLPHREYGVPQQMPFNEYGPPALKYGSPKLNFVGGGSLSSGLHEQIKKHYGAPKPFYGPPHQHAISSQLGIKSISTYGPPTQNVQHKPDISYGAPNKFQFGPPPPQALPLIQSPPQFKPSHQPATSYGPPPSGPLNIPPKQIYGPPPPNYGPPPLPVFNHGSETTLIITGGQHSQNNQQQQQIQIDGSGHSHSVVGSQAPFHTACDGWKPIHAPVGTYIENNNIETQSGYSHVAQAQTDGSPVSAFPTTQYNAGTGSGVSASGFSSTSAGSNGILDGLTDEQLVAVALQSSTFDADNLLHSQDVLPARIPAGNFNQHGINGVDAQALQVSLGSIDDTYSRPPADSYAPGSKHSHKLNHHSSTYSSQNGFGISGPGGSFGPPPPNGRFGPPRIPNVNYGPPQLPPKISYGPPPPPNGKYGIPQPFPKGNYGAPLLSAHGHSNFVHHTGQAGLGIQYGKQTGNLLPFSPHGSAQPNKPVAYRPPVPQGLFEAIGATVQHLDKFGVKPHLQAPIYIPPAANEIPQTGPGNLNIEYGATPHQMPQHIIEQQLPQQRPPQIFVHIEQQQTQEQTQNLHHQQHAEYGVPPPPAQQGPLEPQYLPPPPPAQPQHQYLPPTGPQQEQFSGSSAYSSSASGTFDSSAFAATQYNNEFVHTQALPLQQQQPRFHDCGHGPNLVGTGGFNYQQQQQLQEQYPSGSTTSIAQSIPVAEQHTHFLTGPATSYGPPPSGGNELDHIGYASEKSQVTALPDGTSSAGLPGLDGLKVLSAQKSEPIHFRSQETMNEKTYQLQFGGNGENTANHEEILSADLLQTILNAVEQPQLQHQPLPSNHKAESRSDLDVHEDSTLSQDEKQTDVVAQEPQHLEVETPSNDENLVETPADVQEISPIVVRDENEAKH